MARAPMYKIFAPDGEYVASAKYSHVAVGAALHAGEGANIRLGHSKKDTLLIIEDRHWESYDGTVGELVEALGELRERRK